MKATRLWVPLAFWCILCAFRSLAQEESLTVVGTVTARMQYGDRYYNVHPMASNLKVPPEQWQFRYLPLFLPEVDRDGKLALAKQQVRRRLGGVHAILVRQHSGPVDRIRRHQGGWVPS